MDYIKLNYNNLHLNIVLIFLTINLKLYKLLNIMKKQTKITIHFLE